MSLIEDSDCEVEGLEELATAAAKVDDDDDEAV